MIIFIDIYLLVFQGDRLMNIHVWVCIKASYFNKWANQSADMSKVDRLDKFLYVMSDVVLLFAIR